MYLDLAENLPLFDSVASRTCPRCFDTGIWLTPKNQVEYCPRVLMGDHPYEPNDAAVRVYREAYRLKGLEIYIQNQSFDLARLLTNFSTDHPCPRQEIFDTFYGDTELTYSNQLRKFHGIIEEFRKLWLLPIGSRKAEPSGYWIITELADYKEWYKRATAAPITQLSTIHRNAKHNFPVFAEQMELNFWRDLEEE